MAACPRCGRAMSDEIYVPISEANKGQGKKVVRCSCGNSVTYQEQITAPGMSQEEIYKEKVAHEKELSKSGNRFGKRFCYVTLASVIFWAVCVKGIAGLGIFLGFGFLALLARLLTESYASFCEDDFANQNSIFMAEAKRGLGYILLLGILVVSFIFGFNAI